MDLGFCKMKIYIFSLSFHTNLFIFAVCKFLGFRHINIDDRPEILPLLLAQLGNRLLYILKRLLPISVYLLQVWILFQGFCTYLLNCDYIHLQLIYDRKMVSIWVVTIYSLDELLLPLTILQNLLKDHAAISACLPLIQ